MSRERKSTKGSRANGRRRRVPSLVPVGQAKKLSKGRQRRDVEPTSPNRQYKVFILEDSEFDKDGFVNMIVTANPDRDIVVVDGGWERRNTKDLASRVMDSGCGVVLADLALGVGIDPKGVITTPFQSGPAAIQAIKEEARKRKRRIRVIALTNYPILRKPAEAAGADAVLVKAELTSDLLRRAIRGDDIREYRLMASLVRLEMAAERRWITVAGENPDGREISHSFPAKPVHFSLLRYLARERQEDATDWLVTKDGQFVIGNAVQWSQACRLAKVANPAHEAGMTSIDDNVVAQRASHINEAIRPFVVKDVRLIESLRCGPSAEWRRYALNEEIKEGMINLIE